MEKLLTNKTVSLTELRDPAKVIENAGDTPVAVLNRNTVVGYFVPKSAVEQIDIAYADRGSVKQSLKASVAENAEVLEYLKNK